MKRKSVLFILTCLLLSSCNNEDSNWTKVHIENKDVSIDVDKEGSLVDYSNISFEEKFEIYGKLESYLLENNLFGIPLYQSVNYVKFNPNIIIPTKTRVNENNQELIIGNTIQHLSIPSYGFGVIEEGSTNSNNNTFRISAPYETDFNYVNSNSNFVKEYMKYISSTYFSKRLIAPYDRYEYYSSLASNENENSLPIPLNLNSKTGLATKYKIYVKNDAKYNTLGKYKYEFAGTTIKPGDYITPIKELYTQSNGLFTHNTDIFNTKADLVGMRDYYMSTASGYNEEAWKKVGVKEGQDNKGSYIEFEFINACSSMHASQYLNNLLYSPIPKSFLDKIGGLKNFGKYIDESNTPVDTTLSTGPYVISKWDKTNEAILTKNNICLDSIKGGSNRFNFDNIQIKFTEDPESLFNNNEIDYYKVNTSTLENKENTQYHLVSNNTKLNLNTCDNNEWEYLFGEEGIAYQTKKENYWDVEPAMSNESFIKGLILSVNREEFAASQNGIPSISYLGDADFNLENGLTYNSSNNHKNAMSSYYGETVSTYGYNLEEAKKAFEKASEELIEQGYYKAGDTIKIEMTGSTMEIKNNVLVPLASYFEKAFNESNSTLKLDIEFYIPTNWSDIYYEKQMKGQFDIGFGTISSSSSSNLPDAFELFKSNNSSGFTLNWGQNTNDPNKLIEYKGKMLTYETLCDAPKEAVLVSNDGTICKTHGIALVSNIKNKKDNSRTIVIKYDSTYIEGVCEFEIANVVLFWYPDSSTYEETLIEDFIIDEGEKTITFTLPSELVKTYQGGCGVDIYWSSNMHKEYILDTIYTEFPTYIGDKIEEAKTTD